MTVFLVTSTVITTKQTYAEARLINSGCALPESKLLVGFEGAFSGSKNCNLKTIKSKPTLYVQETLIPTSKNDPEIKREDKKVQMVTSYVQPAISQDPEATLSADLIFQLVNVHRASVNLPPFEQETRICAVAQARKDALYSEINITHTMHSGFYAMNLPYWATENVIYMQNETQSVNWWLNSGVHRAAIEGNYKYACGVCQGRACNMIFTNYEQKSTEV